MSPDGQAIAYTSNQSGRPEVYLVAYPSPGPVRRVSTQGGSQPRWRRDSRELFYLAADGKLMSLSVRHEGSGWNLGVPVPLMTVRTPSTDIPQYQYNVVPDGNRFVVAAEQRAPSDSVIVIRNWAAQHSR